MKLGIKIFAVCSALTMIAPVAFGATTAEQIAQIMADIVKLQAQLTALGGATSSTTFTSNLTVGSKGDEVIALQNLLISANKTGAAALAAAGATGYFGSITKAALAGYQVATGIISPGTGYFGPMSRAYVNSLAVTPGTTFPAGCTSAVGFSPTTGLPCSASVTPGITTATEGSYTVLAAISPLNSTLSAGNNIPVYGIDVKATGSDIKIDRLDLQLAVTSVAGATTHNPSSFITKITVLDGSTKLVEKSIGASDIYQDAANVYWTRLTGLNFVVSKDATKTLTVNMDLVSAVDNARTVVINVYGTQGIRGIDGLGLSTYSALSTVRTHIFSAGGASVLTVSPNGTTPLENNVVVDGTNGVTNVPMLVFNAKATVDAAVITTINLRQSYSATGATALGTLNTIRVYDGATEVGAGIASGTGALDGNTILTGLSIAVPKDTTKTLTVKMDFAKGFGTGEVASVSIDMNEGIVFRKADSTTASGTIAADIMGYGMHLYRAAPVFELVGPPTIAKTTSAQQTSASNTLDATIVLRVTPRGGSMAALDITSSGIYFASSATAANLTANAIFTMSLTPASSAVAYPVDIPFTATYTGHLDGKTLSAAGFYRMAMDFIKWQVSPTAAWIHQTWGLETFKTADIVLP